MKHPGPQPLKTQTAADLVATNLPPIRMIVGKVFPAGLLLLAGDPKAGKSLLMQDLAVSVAMGTAAWGTQPVEQGDVLYLAREGGDRSFRERLVKMLDGQPAPNRLHISYESCQLGAELEVQLEWWLTAVTDPRLVVIDTYTAVAPETRGVNRHREEYATLAGMADLATRWPNTLFVVVHHTRKGEGGEDKMHRISGSQGMTAVTDGNAVLSREVAARRCLLTVRPRNAEECDLVLERDPETLRWSTVGTDERTRLSDGRQAILEWLERNPAGGTPKTIADGLGRDGDSVRQLLTQMERARQVERPQRGLYVLPRPVSGQLL